MDGKPAIYLGRIVSKENFRAFIYASDGRQRLAESWDEFEALMQIGVWFATADEAKQSIEVKEPEKAASKPRPSRAKPKAVEVKEEVQDEVLAEDAAPADDLAFEVTDDFLPKG